METKSFLALTIDELYEVNGGQGLVEDPLETIGDVTNIVGGVIGGDPGLIIEGSYGLVTKATKSYISSDDVNSKKSSGSSDKNNTDTASKKNTKPEETRKTSSSSSSGSSRGSK